MKANYRSWKRHTMGEFGFGFGKGRIEEQKVN